MIWNTLNLLMWIIIFHEMGHYLYLRMLLKRDIEIRISNMTIKIGYPLDYRQLSNLERAMVYFSGILMGLVPLTISVAFDVRYAVVILAYLIACRQDIKNIRGESHGQRKNERD